MICIIYNIIQYSIIYIYILYIYEYLAMSSVVICPSLSQAAHIRRLDTLVCVPGFVFVVQSLVCLHRNHREQILPQE